MGGSIWISFSTFKKLPPDGNGQNSGIIYGSEAVGNDANGIPLRNTASSDANGHAVMRETLNQWLRNTTAGQTDEIDTSTNPFKGLSANGNPPYGQ
jgi:hypothetical protein